MAKSLEQLTQQLSAIEPDESTFTGIGPDEVPLLEQLLNAQPWLAARAVYALSRIKDVRAMRLLSQRVRDDRVEVRIALARVAPVLAPEAANTLLTRLLSDHDPGVRQFAIQSVPANPISAIREQLQEIAEHDPAAFVRESAEAAKKK